jgi:predicted site-specific integrase-resolvase
MPTTDKPVFIAERRAAERYGVSWRTLIRWDKRPELGFPPVIKIGTRRFRELAKLEAWERANAKRAAAKVTRPRPHKSLHTSLET